MGDSALILGVSGLRGIVGESLTAEVAMRYAAAFGAWLIDHNETARQVVVVRDGRAGGEVMYRAALDGLAYSGLDVIGCDVAMTPTAGVAVSGPIDGAIVVTASHNPGQWNGLKCLVPAGNGTSGQAPSQAQANEIISIFRKIQIERSSVSGWGRIEMRDSADLISAHGERVVSSVRRCVGDQGLGRLSVVLDSVNASGAVGAERFLRGSGVDVTQLHGDGSGVFPHTPEPTRENLSGEGGLCDVVPGVKADVGFAQDPDADRLAVVDEHGEYIGEEYTLVLCAMALMEARLSIGGREDEETQAGRLCRQEGKKPVFVVNLSTSRMIDDVAAHYGAEVVRTAVGEANVVEAMKSLTASGRDVVLGGEGNGGVIWADVTYVRDSLSGMALILSLMARTGKTVSELVSMVNSFGPTAEVQAHGYTILKAKSDLASKADAEPVVEHLHRVYGQRGDCRVDLVDGIRIDWDEKGVWAHVRASNTEAIMRVIVEAPSETEARSVALEIEGEIGKSSKAGEP